MTQRGVWSKVLVFPVKATNRRRSEESAKEPPPIPSSSIATEPAGSVEDEIIIIMSRPPNTTPQKNNNHDSPVDESSLPLGTSSVGHRQRKRTLSRSFRTNNTIPSNQHKNNNINAGESYHVTSVDSLSSHQHHQTSSNTYFMVDLDDDDTNNGADGGNGGTLSPADQESLALYKLLQQDMYESSAYFIPSDKNPPRTNIPTFTRHEMQLADDILGQGEFGTVRAVTSFGFKPIKTVHDTGATTSTSGTTTKTTKQQNGKRPSSSSSSRLYRRSSSYESYYPEQPEATTADDDHDGNYDDLLEIISWSSSSEDDVSDLEDETEPDGDDTRNVAPPPSIPPSSRSSSFHHPARIISTGSISKMATAHAHGMSEFAQEQVKASMIRRPTRDSLPRYAVKYVKDTIREESRADAILDLASEALFLSRLSHPNIVRLRATVGVPGTSSFMLVLDRLSDTLAHKIQYDWKRQAQSIRQQTRPWAMISQRFQKKANNKTTSSNDNDAAHVSIPPETADHTLFLERLLATYDIARALRHLHQHHLLFRDVKPENVAFDSRGQVRLFDFGLCKELKACDGNVADDAYRATGVTGSRRYMAPEVVRCLPYGFSADVYSWTVCTWQVFALETPYAEWDASQHMDKCVMANKRPSKQAFAQQACHVKKGSKNNPLYSCQKRLWETVVEPGWAAEPRDRPTMDSICRTLHSELALLAPMAENGDYNNLSLSDRSQNLMNLSVHSIRRIMADR